MDMVSYFKEVKEEWQTKTVLEKSMKGKVMTIGMRAVNNRFEEVENMSGKGNTIADVVLKKKADINWSQVLDHKECFKMIGEKIGM